MLCPDDKCVDIITGAIGQYHEALKVGDVLTIEKRSDKRTVVTLIHDAAGPDFTYEDYILSESADA